MIARSSRGRVAIVVVIGLPLLWLSVTATIAGVYAHKNPDVALAWWPWSAEAAAAKSSALAMANPDGKALVEAALLAEAALKRQPVSPVAARTLAIVWGAQNKPEARFTRLMRYSERLSRHDPVTQLWLLEAEVAHDDVAGALVHYDRALRTAPALRPQLLPVLAAAADNPAIARQLGPLIVRKPPWRYDFIAAFIPRTQNPESLAALLPAFSLDAASTGDRQWLGVAIERMVALGKPTMALRFYRQIAPVAAGRERVNNADFARDPGPEPFDWSLNDAPNLVATRELTEAGDFRLRASVAADAVGWLARQTLVLDPGRYRLVVKASNDAASGSVLNIRVICADGLVLAHPDVSEGVASELIVPSNGCTTALLSLEARGALDGPPVDYFVREVSLTHE